MPATYTDATIKRCATIIANASTPSQRATIAAMLTGLDEPKAAPTPRKAATPKATPKLRRSRKSPDAWKSERPSKSQIKRNRIALNAINCYESLLGLSETAHADWTPDGTFCAFTAGSYSDHYKVLAANRDALRQECIDAGLIEPR